MPTDRDFGHDLVNIATYLYEILSWLPHDRIWEGRSVVAVSAMTEALIVAMRSAYDAIAGALAHVAAMKANQAPGNSLHDLANWAKKYPGRARPEVVALLATKLDGFWKLREVRDLIVHKGADTIIYTDRKQFTLFFPSVREPLLPFLADHCRRLLDLADESARTINAIIDLPRDRLGSRVVSGIDIPAWHRLQEIESNYAAPVPP